MKPFLESQQFRDVLAAAECPDLVLRAMKGKLFPSGHPDQALWNGGLRDYIKDLISAAEELSSEEDAYQAIMLYTYGQDAVRLLNTQKTVYIPEEVIEARNLFKILISSLSRWANYFPHECRKIFYFMNVFSRRDTITKPIQTPHGQCFVGVVRDANSRVWWPCIMGPNWETGEVRGRRYIRAGALNPKRLSIETKYLFNHDSTFWGVELQLIGINRDFAWDIDLRTSDPVIWSVWEDHNNSVSIQHNEIRINRLAFSANDAYQSSYCSVNRPSIIFDNYEFDPEPSAYIDAGDHYVLLFPPGYTDVLIRHRYFRSAKVPIGHHGVKTRLITLNASYD